MAVINEKTMNACLNEKILLHIFSSLSALEIQIKGIKELQCGAFLLLHLFDLHFLQK